MNRWVRSLVWLVCLIAVVVGRSGLVLADPRPNFLVIVSDDQRYDDNVYQYMPGMWWGIMVPDGVWFRQAYDTTPLCCPSRSSIFTGMYAHRHGVIGNTYPLGPSGITTVGQRLKAAGYHTGLVGKYLNTASGDPRPEFDYWVAIPGGGVDSYYNYDLNINGTWHRGVTTYITNNLGDRAKTFLQNAPANQPFLLFFTPVAPHAPADPAPGEGSLPFPDLDVSQPQFNEPDVSDKPAWLQATPQRTDLSAVEQFHKNQLRALVALDRKIGELLTVLTNRGMMDNTVIMYISDNGMFWAEHRLRGKKRVYQESIHVPFAIRYPPLTRNHADVDDHLVANIDITPTIYELAGVLNQVPAQEQPDGMSLVGLLNGSRPWRDALMIEGWPQSDRTDAGDKNSESYQAMHTDRFVYVETYNDRAELYDLWTDPQQLTNLIPPNGVIANPFYAQVRDDLRKRLHPCYVLGAAFGSPSAPEIAILDEFRQRVFPLNRLHRAYLAWYSRVGPKLAAFLQDKPALKAGVRALASPGAVLAYSWLEHHPRRPLAVIPGSPDGPLGTNTPPDKDDHDDQD